MNLRHSIATSFSTKYIDMALGLLASMLLARLLTPADFGVYSIAASVVAMGYLFRNFGVGQFIVQAEVLTDELIRAAFTLTLSISWIIGLLLALTASWLADVYGSPGVRDVQYLLALNFFLLPFGAITDAVLRRNMEFGKLAIINVSGAVVGLVVGVGSAYMGARYLSIAWASNAVTVATILLTIVFRPKGLPWLPGVAGLPKVFGFGLKIGLLDMVNKGSDSATELIVGKVHGLPDLGFYSRAYGAFMLFEYAFVMGIRPVVLPFLSQAKRDKTKLGPIFLRIVGFVSIFMLPFYTFLFVEAADVIRVLYGDQWDAAVPLLKIMCIGGMLLAPTIFFDQLLIAHGRPGQALRYQLLSQGVRIGALLLLVNGALDQAAIAIVIGALMKSGIAIRLASRYFDLDFVGFIREISPSLLAALAVGLAVWGCSLWTLEWDSHWYRLLVALGVSSVAWLASVIVFKHPISNEMGRLLGR